MRLIPVPRTTLDIASNGIIDKENRYMKILMKIKSWLYTSLTDMIYAITDYEFNLEYVVLRQLEQLPILISKLLSEVHEGRITKLHDQLVIFDKANICAIKAKVDMEWGNGNYVGNQCIIIVQFKKWRNIMDKAQQMISIIDWLLSTESISLYKD